MRLQRKQASNIAKTRRRGERRRVSRQRLGAAVVEFAIVANVMFLIIFISIEFARLNMMRNLAQDAAYFAARTAMVPGGTSAEAVAEANRLLAVVSTQNAEVTVNNGQALTDATKQIRVRVRIPISDNALFTPMFTGNQMIEANATMKTERYDGFYNPND